MTVSKEFILEVEFAEDIREVNEFIATSSDEEVGELFEDARSLILYDSRIPPTERLKRIQYCEFIEESYKDLWTNSRLNKTLNTGAFVQDFLTDLKARIEVLSQDYTNVKSRLPSRRHMQIGGAVLVAGLIAALARKHYRKAAHGSCAKYKGRELVLCRVKMIQEFERVIELQKKYCDGTNNPEKCKKHLKKSIQGLEKEKESWLRKTI
jgi:hypothetical protein